MDKQDRPLEVRVDNFTRFWLAAIGTLLVLLVIGLWGRAWPEGDARAVEPMFDSGAQRKAMVEAQEKTNEKLDELIKLFRSGEAKVQMAGELDGKAKVETHEGKEKPK